MKKRADRYYLVETDFVIEEGGVSMYKLLKEGDFSRDLTQKYHDDVSALLDQKLADLTKKHAVPEKEIKRIKDLITELVHTNEILVTYDYNEPEIKKILEK